MDVGTDKLSIKNLLFTKAIPNCTISDSVNGHKIFACTDCGDKFVFESSYNDHINRRSAKISYMCRYCNSLRIFYNRCNLLWHIRSHAFKTATINVTDLKIEPLPLRYFKIKPSLPESPASSSKVITVSESTKKPPPSTVVCFECKANITVTDNAYKARASHCMQYTKEVFACPVCLFALPTICALKIHLRIHLQCPPYYCPECGIHLANKNVQYPYNHDCEGFKMMRATARLNCSVPDCSLFHPNDYRDHMKKYHLKKVYKCPFCVVACFNESTMEKHLKGHKTVAKALLFYQCDLCPGRYLLQNPNLNDGHLKSHINTTIFPCWACGSSFQEITSLLHHFLKKHNKFETIGTAIKAILTENCTNLPKPKSIYRVVKKCDQCKRSFTYTCKYEEIQILPIECPYRCTSTMQSDISPEQPHDDNNEDFITCHLCKEKLSQNWDEIKTHYAELHRNHKCLDVKVMLTRIDVKEYLSQRKVTKSNLKALPKVSKKTRNRQLYKTLAKAVTASRRSPHHVGEEEPYSCYICGTHYCERTTFENHMVIHRDPCMAYQCLECGQSFIVKPSFSKHLLLEHDITDPEDYINNKPCFNENALKKHKNTIEIEIPLADNQCKICRELFDCPEDLKKHFRVHGMAFLMKNTSNKNTTSS